VPEGNALHRYAEHQSALFAGKVVNVDAPNGRFAEGAALLNRRKLRAIEAYGKHLIYDFGRNRQLHIHLGLYGKFRDGDMPFPEPKGALRLRIWTPKHWIELRGPNACDVVSDAQRDEILGRLGPDPLRDDADPAAFITRVRASRAPVGALLIDQSVIAGPGNIFRAELLYRAKLDPFRPGNTVRESQLEAIWSDAAELMRAAVAGRRIVTTWPEHRELATRYVYKRKGLPCIVCGTKVRMQEFFGRKLYWCPTCQPEPRKRSSNVSKSASTRQTKARSSRPSDT
jgi:formamidopyrimidine-DNA glycosylase